MLVREVPILLNLNVMKLKFTLVSVKYLRNVFSRSFNSDFFRVLIAFLFLVQLVFCCDFSACVIMHPFLSLFY